MRTVTNMQNRTPSAIVVYGVGVVVLTAIVGATMAILLMRGSTAMVETDTGPNSTIEVSIDRSGTGVDCIGGICVENLPDEIAYEEIGAYLAVLREALADDPGKANACHTVAHEIGRAANVDRGVSALLELDDGRCLYGYQHGVLEGWSLGSSIDVLVGGINDACSAYEYGSTVGGLGADEIEYARGSCAHGVGHAIALQNVGNVREAVMYCAALGAGQIGGCAGGVYMAYATDNPSQGGDADTLMLTVDEVVKLCPSLEGEYQTECWAKLWLLGLRVGLLASEVAKLCPMDPQNGSCGRGVGEGLYYEYGMDPDDAIEACPMNVQPNCYYGIAWSEANAWAGSGGTVGGYQSICGRFSGETNVACRQSEAEALRGSVQ